MQHKARSWQEQASVLMVAVTLVVDGQHKHFRSKTELGRCTKAELQTIGETEDLQMSHPDKFTFFWALAQRHPIFDAERVTHLAIRDHTWHSYQLWLCFREGEDIQIGISSCVSPERRRTHYQGRRNNCEGAVCMFADLDT